MDQEQTSVVAKRFRKTAITSVVVLVVAIVAFSLFNELDETKVSSKVSTPVAEAIYPVIKTIRYSFLLKNTSNELIKNAEFKAYAPVKQTASQRLNATHDYTLATDPLGNQVMNFVVTDIPPYGSKVITITAEMGLTETPNIISEEYLDDYLVEEKFIELNNPKMKDLSGRLSKVKHKPVSKTVYDWVSRHIEDAGYVRTDQGALYALEKRKGDCTEYMYLAVALLRGSKVPARGIGGFVVSTNSVLRASDYHNWAEYYEEDTWHLLDAQKKVFNTNHQDYVAFRVFGKKGQNALSQSQRFLAYDGRLKVRMN